MVDAIENLSAELRFHRSPDTVAKKYFHTSENKALLHLKAIIIVFFIFEQSINQKLEYETEKEIFGEPFFKNKRVIDDRYDAFIASILKPKKGFEFLENISILSWNYDFQLELCYKHYAGCYWDVVQERINSIPYFGADTKDLDPNKTYRLIHLNGVALSFPEEPSTNNGRNLLRKAIGINEYPKDDLFYIFSSIINQKNGITNYPDKYLFFGWENVDENGKPNKDFIIYKKSLEIAEKTDVLVVIGYSFPTFNNEIDSMILNKMKNLSKIVVQSHQPELIADAIISLLNEDNFPKNQLEKLFKFVSPDLGFYLPNTSIVNTGVIHPTFGLL